MQREDGRQPDQLRSLSIERGFMQHAEGSALIKMGNTETQHGRKIVATITAEQQRRNEGDS